MSVPGRIIMFHKILLAAVLAAVLAFWSGAAAVSAETEAIERFDSSVAVGMDGRITVTERIDYRFPEPRHGIYRDIPVRYDEGGKLLEVPVTVLGVTDAAGAPYPMKLEKSGTVVRLKIGDPDRTITGTHTYVIRYRVDGGLKYFPDHDELYWNATGTGWSVPILAATATVTLPDAVPAESVKATCYTGALGSTLQECAPKVAGRTATFSAAGPLTVVVGWQAGVVAKLLPEEIKPPAYAVAIDAAVKWLGARYGSIRPDVRDGLWKFMLFLPILFPLLTLRRFVGDWRRLGRDPRGRDTIVVEYAPPDGITPAELEALIDERAENKGIWATLVDLASRGFLSIKEVDPPKGSASDHEFTLRQDLNKAESLRAFERTILTTLMAGSTSTTLSQAKKDMRFYGKIDGIKGEVYDSLVARGYYEERPDKVRARYLGQSLAIFFLGIIAGMPYLYAVFAPGWEFLIIVPAVAIATGVVGAVLAQYMTRRTPAGVAAFEKSIGFREYLEKAERFRSRWQADQGIFARMLPYAVAFGVVDKWAAAFVNESVDKPDWYEGRAWRDGRFDSRAFAGSFESMRSSLSNTISAAPAPSSSGSGFSSGGGGGRSGGGRGGGGGGSW